MTAAEIVRDAIARAARVLEALGDCDYELAGFIAEDLEHDLSAWLAHHERREKDAS
jgi:hypothetical protein